MSLEAWSDEGNIGPEGYVAEDCYEELKQEQLAAFRTMRHTHETLLEAKAMMPATSKASTILDSAIENTRWHLDKHVPRLFPAESWQDALKRIERTL